jgi:hypothetical protein
MKALEGHNREWVYGRYLPPLHKLSSSIERIYSFHVVGEMFALNYQIKYSQMFEGSTQIENQYFADVFAFNFALFNPISVGKEVRW